MTRCTSWARTPDSLNDKHAPKRPTGTRKGVGEPLLAFPATGDDSWGTPDQIPVWADTPAAQQAPAPVSAPETTRSEYRRGGSAGSSSTRQRTRNASYGAEAETEAVAPRRRRSAAGPGAERTAGRRAPKEEVSPESQAREIVLRQLTASAKSRDQLRRKLAEKEIPEDIAEQVLDRFEEVNLVDDTAFAEAWVRGRARSRGLARSAIRRELRQKGIDGEQAEEALEQLTDEDEAQTARTMVDKKLRSPSMGADREKEVRRLVGMLCRKGYGPGLAFRIVGDAWDETYAEDH